MGDPDGKKVKPNLCMRQCVIPQMLEFTFRITSTRRRPRGIRFPYEERKSCSQQFIPALDNIISGIEHPRAFTYVLSLLLHANTT